MARTVKEGATIGEVAAAAGVSRSTVSRVMNQRSTVAADIAERVRAAAAQLQYRPSSVARSLSLGRTNTLALVVPDLHDPVHQQILRGVTAAAAGRGYRVLVAESPADPAEEAEAALEARLRCDALVLVTPRMPERDLHDLLERSAPTVLVGRPAHDVAVPVVSVDHARGTSVLVDHLAALGHRRDLGPGGPRGDRGAGHGR
ncbi:LacI family DNA-binding transcriptional regulator, partial [Kineococcus glutinatus]|uniref:LacI family DNA-binding transcriptional regulator n=1 Tax=Kineococcus glutinatus TaxID=1070872 RepID=UPI0031E751CD